MFIARFNRSTLIIRGLLVALLGTIISTTAIGPQVSIAKAAPSSTCVGPSNYTSCGLEYDGGRYQLGTYLPVGTAFTLQMWIQVNRTVPTYPTNTGSYLFGADKCGYFGFHANGNGVYNGVTTSRWVIDAVCNAQYQFACPQIQQSTWVGIVIEQKNGVGMAMWMNGQQCYAMSGDSVLSTTTYSSYSFGNGPNYVGGSNGASASQWAMSDVRWLNYGQFDLASATITPDAFPLNINGNTNFILNSNVPGNSTDGTGYYSLTKISSAINAAPVILTPQSINLSISNTSLAYGQSATLSTSGSNPAATGAITYSVSGGCSVAGNVITATGSSGTCSVIASIAADSTYAQAASSPVTITLSKANQATFSVSASNQTSSYSGSAYSVIPTLSTSGGSDNGAITFSVANGTATGCQLSSSTSVNATLTATSSGTCVITATKAATTNYNQSTATVTITFTPATSTTISVTGSSTYTYNGSAQGPSSATVSGSSGQVTYSYSGTGSTTYAASPTKPTAAGTYQVIATVAADTNYISAISIPFTFAISAATQSPALVITSTSGTYGSNLTLTTSGGSGTGAVSYIIDSGPCTVLGSTLVPSAAGTCYVTATKASDTNYFVASSTSTSISIAKATPTIALILSIATPVYGSVDTITATSSIPGSINFYLAGSTAISGCQNISTTLVSPFTAQCSWVANAASTSFSLTATLTPTDTVNYTSATSSPSTPTSGKASITITPTAGQSKIYGSQDPTLTYTITSGALIGSDQLSGALSYASAGQNTSVGSYAITLGSLANSNYNISLSTPSVSFIINQATQTAVSLSSLSSAYNPSGQTVTLTGSGGSGSGTYSYALDSGNTTPGCSVSGSTLSYTSAGSCIIDVTRSSSTNYLARTDVVTYSIDLASQTITFNSLSSKTYSSDTFTVSAIASSSLAVTFSSGSPGICVASGTNGSTISLLGVGTCVINANQSGNSIYAAATQVTQTFSVTQRLITITASAATKYFGDSDPSFSYTITSGSLLSGDTLTGSLSRSSGESPGTYAINIGTLSNPNYSITFTSANLTINKKATTLTLSYPNNNLLRYQVSSPTTDSATVTSSAPNSDGGVISFNSPSSTICSVDSTSGTVTPIAIGNCVVNEAITAGTDYDSSTVQATVNIVPISASLAGIAQSNLTNIGWISASSVLSKSLSGSTSNTSVNVSVPAGALPDGTPISVDLLGDATSQKALIANSGNVILAVVVSWQENDGTVPNTASGNPIQVTLTNGSITAGSQIYSVLNNVATLLGTAQVNGSITISVTQDPVIVITQNTPSNSGSSGSSGSSGGGSSSNTKRNFGTQSNSTTISPQITVSKFVVVSPLVINGQNQLATCEIQLQEEMSDGSLTGLSSNATYKFTLEALGVPVTSQSVSSPNFTFDSIQLSKKVPYSCLVSINDQGINFTSSTWDRYTYQQEILMQKKTYQVSEENYSQQVAQARINFAAKIQSLQKTLSAQLKNTKKLSVINKLEKSFALQKNLMKNQYLINIKNAQAVRVASKNSADLKLATDLSADGKFIYAL